MILAFFPCFFQVPWCMSSSTIGSWIGIFLLPETARTIMSSAESRNGKVGSQRDSSPSEASPSAGPEGEDGKLGFSWGIVGRLIGK